MMERRGKQKKTPNQPEQEGNTGANNNAPDANTHDGTDPGHATVSLETIFGELKSFREDNQHQLKQIKEEINKFNKRLDEAETRIDGAETRIQTMEEIISEILRVQEEMRAKLTDQEGRARRQNIRVYGVPEGLEEGTTMITFLEHLLKSQLEFDDSTDLQIERAHRALARRDVDAAKPRSIVARFASFRVKEEIVRRSWAKKGFSWRGNKINIDHDYAPEVLRERKKYSEVKRVLKNNNIHFKTRFPARLRVHYEEGMKEYKSAEEATKDMAARKFQIAVINSPGSLTERIQQLTWQTATGRAGREHQRKILNYKEKLQAFRRSSTPDKI